MNKKRFTRPAILLAAALAFAACSNEDIQVDNPDPKPTDGKVMVSITAAMDEEGRGTRSSFVYGTDLDNPSGNEYEKFQWEAKDSINLRFSSQLLDISKNVLFAPAVLKAGQDATTFSGEINKYSGQQTIYAVSPAVQIGGDDEMQTLNETLVWVNYPKTVTQNGTDLSHLGATDYMWARVTDFDLDANKENPLEGMKLNFKHLGAMLRFQIKNTSETGKKYILQSVTMSEEGGGNLLRNETMFNIASDQPQFEPSNFFSTPKTVKVEKATEIGKYDTFDAYMMVPASFAGTDLSLYLDYRFVVKVVVTDEGGEEYYREIVIDPKEENGKFLNNGFAAGMRYYFVISVNETNLKEAKVKVNVETAGNLWNLITNPGYITNLTVTGNINQEDFWFMNQNMSNLAKLDLSGATIVEYKNGPLYCEANTLPSYAFDSNQSLQYITLPENLKKISEYAFDACSSLTGDLTIPKSVDKIDVGVFSNCNFTKVHLYWAVGEIITYNPDWKLPDVPIVVPNGLENAYKVKGWENAVERKP